MRKWVAPLIFLLAIVFQLPLVQAQDNSGQQVSGLYELVVQGTVQDRICLYQTTALSVKVEASLLVAGGPAAGHVAVRDAAISVTAQDPSIASVTVGSGWQGFEPTVPFESVIGITGVAVGTTAITIEAAGRNTNRFGDGSGFQLRKTIPVRVVPCDYRVNGTSFWVTNAHRANLLVNVTLRNARLTSARGLTFGGEDNFYTLTTTTNVLAGCMVDRIIFVRQLVNITGAIVDDELHITMTFPVESGSHVLDCGPDSRIPESEVDYHLPPLNLTPADLEIVVPIHGGVWHDTHVLNHAQGSATGFTNLTVTPIRQ